MKAGDIVFVKGHSLISHIVTTFDEGKFSHVAIAVSPTHICEAMWNSRVRIVPMEYEDYEIVSMNMSQGQQDMAIHSAIQYCGDKYDFRTILSIMLKGKVSVGNPNAYICSELVTKIMRDAGRDIGNDLVSPNELYNRLRHKLDQESLSLK